MSNYNPQNVQTDEPKKTFTVDDLMSVVVFVGALLALVLAPDILPPSK